MRVPLRAHLRNDSRLVCRFASMQSARAPRVPAPGFTSILALALQPPLPFRGLQIPPWREQLAGSTTSPAQLTRRSRRAAILVRGWWVGCLQEAAGGGKGGPMPQHGAALLAVAALAAMVTSPSPGRRSVDGDVRLYGADPSPGNDDTAALQKALANCSNTNAQVYTRPARTPSRGPCRRGGIRGWARC